MNSFNHRNLKAEKANAMMNQRKLQRIAKVFRFVEVCAVLILISRISIQVPVAVKNSSDYFRGFSVFMVSPQFVFVIGNVIIITLFAQSGQFSAQGSKSKSSESDLYHQFIQNSTKNQEIKEEQSKYPEKQNIRTEDPTRNQRIINEENNKYPEKKGIRTEESIKKQRVDGGKMKWLRVDGGKMKWLKKQSVKTGDRKCLDYRRCETQKLMEVRSGKPRSVLRRSETEKSRSSYAEDGMTNEEFRQTVEEFIARQQRLRREEEDSMI